MALDHCIESQTKTGPRVLIHCSGLLVLPGSPTEKQD